MNNILVINVNWLGDVIFSAPVFTNLRKHFPKAKITCLAVPRVQEILRHVPNCDELMVFDERGTHRSVLGKLRLIGELRSRKFDGVFVLHRSLTRALLPFLAGIPVRVGYDEKNRGIFLTHPVAPVPCVIHRSDYYLRVLEGFGLKVEDRACLLNPPVPEIVANVETLLASHGVGSQDHYVVIHPGGNWHLKRWPLGHYATLINKLTASDPNLKVVVTGAANEAALAQDLQSLAGKSVIVLTGKISLPQFLAVLGRARLLVSGDSGPLHLASALGTKAIALFGPTRPEITGPRGKSPVIILQKDVGCNREACYNLACPDNVCLWWLYPQEVLDAIRQIQST